MALHNNECTVNPRLDLILFSFVCYSDADKRRAPRYLTGRSVRTAAVFGTYLFIHLGMQ